VYELPSVVNSDGTAFLCWTVIQFIAALSLQIALKLQNLYTFFGNIFTATEARFLPKAPTQNRPPDSRLLFKANRFYTAPKL
jgi:hypothetical protein